VRIRRLAAPAARVRREQHRELPARRRLGGDPRGAASLHGRAREDRAAGRFVAFQLPPPSIIRIPLV
jgi:hypothetical protein